MEKTGNEYGTIKVINRWAGVLPIMLKQWRTFIWYALALTLVSIVTNRWTYACQGRLSGYWCHWYAIDTFATTMSFIVSLVGTLFFLGMFASDFYNGLRQNIALCYQDVLMFTKQKIKSGILAVAGFIYFTLLLAIIIYILNPPGFESSFNGMLQQWHIPGVKLHTANENWRIELIYFTIIFVCAMVPLFLMRCSAFVAYYFNESKAQLSKIYHLTFSRSYVGIFCFLMLMLLCTVQHLSVIRYFNKVMEAYNCLTLAVVSEYCNNLLLLLYLALFLSLFQAEYLQLRQKEEAQNLLSRAADDAEIREEDTAAVAAIKSKTQKSAKKKKTQRKAKATVAEKEE